MQLTITVPREIEAALIAEAAATGENLKILIEKMLREKAASRFPGVPTAAEEFDQDMVVFAEDATGNETYAGSYSRGDIYVDHD